MRARRKLRATVRAPLGRLLEGFGVPGGSVTTIAGSQQPEVDTHENTSRRDPRPPIRDRNIFVSGGSFEVVLGAAKKTLLPGQAGPGRES
jgi:hypothetical protein